MDFQGLLAALSDSERPVRIAALRALVRLPLDKETESLVRPHRALYERKDLMWSTWVPDEETRARIFEIIRYPEEQERLDAKKIVAGTNSPITRRFAELVIGPDLVGENLLTEAHAVAASAAEIGDQFVPDIPGLFAVYLLFLRRAANFWFRWVQDHGGATELPSWFPVTEGALAASRQIEWVVSRAGTEPLLAGLRRVLEHGGPRERFAAAQLTEWARRSEPVKSPWEFGGDSGPQDILYSFEFLSKKSDFAFSLEDLPLAAVLGTSLSQYQPGPSGERKISFWISEAAGTSARLEIQRPYTGNFRVGKPVEGSFVLGPDAVVPDSDVPAEGLPTIWTIVPSDVKLEAIDSSVSVSQGGLAFFALLIPAKGDSQTVQLHVTPLSAQAKLMVLIQVNGKLYRELRISLAGAAKTVKDAPLARIGEADLDTNHEWTTPTGRLSMHVWKVGRATVFGDDGTNSLAGGQEVRLGTDKALLSRAADDVRQAAEDFRKVPQWTQYLNDIDANELMLRLANFQPQYNWSNLDQSLVDQAHKDSWGKAACSDQLLDLAYYGHVLYNTLFPPGADSRTLLDALPAGHQIDIVWTQDSDAGWIPHLPWQLLYTADVDRSAPVDATKFWGLRFRIQYTAYNAGPGARALGGRQDACCTSLLYFGQSAKDPATAEAAWQRQIWTGLGALSRSCVLPPAGATSAKQELLKALQNPEAATSPAGLPVAVLYLFCQYGPDASGKPILRFGLDASQSSDILREPEISTGKLASRPLVFANACASAACGVYSANSLMKSFFDRGCRAFIGTDGLVPTPMASRFAITFFYFFLRLVDKEQKPMAGGEALAQARLFLWCNYWNIGGLLYSYLNQYDLYMASQTEIDQLRRWK